MLTGSEIRRMFLDYFVQKGHREVHSSPLVPQNDPTLLFTNAGMNQFKDVFLGLEKREYNKATTSQKCVRAGGKHNDLDNVGYTNRHHTFFEMLGNFSFGDYFKERAIPLAWELVTKVFERNPKHLLVTIYHDDEDAYRIWKKVAGFSDDKIIRIATSDNFWSAGETGPCGPCSEIFLDQGDKVAGGPPGSADEDGDRFLEFWNLVFMQFDEVEPGKRIPLPRPSIDTGMGLERMAALLQGVASTYEIDLFRTLINAVAEATSADAHCRQTLARGRATLDEERRDLTKGAELSGETAFRLYDTYGFPLDLTQDALRARGIGVDTDGFAAAMERQRAEARKAWAGSGDAATETVWFAVRDRAGATEFLGYDAEEAAGIVTALLADGVEVQKLKTGQAGSVVL